MKAIFTVGCLFFVTSSFAQTFSVNDSNSFRDALKNAEFNGESDIIVLDQGIYTASNDGRGTFVFSGKETYSLTIEGKSDIDKENIVIDGENKYQVLKLENSKAADFIIKNLMIQNGQSKDLEGGGVYSNQNINIKNVIITNNYSSKEGGGIYGSKNIDIDSSTISQNGTKYYAGGVSGKNISVTNSIIQDNNSEYAYGGIFAQSTEVINSIISSNSAAYNYGGIYAKKLTINNSTISSNQANKNYGAIAGEDLLIANSKISANSAGAYGGIVGSKEIIIINSIISDHEKEGSVTGENVNVVNSIFANNDIAIYGKGVFINNIFENNTQSDINLIGNSSLYNNYINYSKIDHLDYYDVEQANNIRPTAGQLQFENSTYKLLSGTLGVDAGLNYDSEIFKKAFEDSIYEKMSSYFEKDILSNRRVVNSIIDLGAYESDSTPYLEGLDNSKQFLEDLYEGIFDKEPTEKEIDEFLEQINEDDSAAQIAKAILVSEQFKNLILTDEEFIKMLYRAFFGRETDDEGLEYWLKQMHENNMLREEMIRKFAFSEEFQNICKKYFLDPYDDNDLLAAFIERFYNILFQRNSDPEGLEFWKTQLSQNLKTPTEIVKFFYLSDEFIDLNYDDNKFMDIAYRGLMNREADGEGKSYWIERLNNDITRENLIDDFLKSNEFKELQIGL